MGQEIPYKHFTAEDAYRFKKVLAAETEQLGALLEQGKVVTEHSVGGLELEAWLVGSKAEPRAENVAFLQRLNHPEVVPELSLFNIELNVAPQILQGQALQHIHQNLAHNWRACERTAQAMGLDIMAIGTHPSLRDSQLTLTNMSQSQRYRVLNEQILALRKQRPITLDVKGREHLCSLHHDVMLEAATTSFQIHMQVKPQEAVADYNASQVISAPLVALSANSPYVFGKDLLDESRIPLFEQAIDLGPQRAKRVCFGERYVEGSLQSCFEENQADYEPLIPMVFADTKAFLPHLRLHNGTIWRWNRPIVAEGPDGKVELRIENRVVPSGPTLLDMIANAAFYWGSVTAMRDQMHDIAQRLPFALAKQNFYSALRDSLNCRLVWLDGKTYNCDRLILDKLIPAAETGLGTLGIGAKQASQWLGIIQQRVANKQNGAAWQRAWVAVHGGDMQALSMAYLRNQQSDQPVHEWSIK